MTADLRPRSPLGTVLDLPAAWLREVTGRSFIELRLPVAQDGFGADTAAVQSVLGLELPAAGLAAGDGGQLAVWLGPGWWLLDSQVVDGPERSLEAALVHRLRDVGDRVCAVDVSAGYAVLALAGRDAPAVLGHGCSIDLHPRVFGPGSAARTMLAKAQVVLAQIDEVPTYRLWVRSSYARYLVDWLLDAATEYQPVGATSPS